jgi:Ion channel
MPGSLPPNAPLWRRHTHADGYAYGWLLVLISASLVFQLAAGDTGLARVITLILQGVALLAALRVSGAHHWVVRAASIATSAAVLGALGLLIGSGGDLDDALSRLVTLMLVVLAPLAIVRGIVRQARQAGAITLRTMFGVLCVYLLVGMAYAFAYGAIEALSHDPFFAQITNGDQSDFLYFSFATLTTTGFGDLTAGTSLGRSFVITEALIGQIYLVTVVSLIVANLGRPRPRPAR